MEIKGVPFCTTDWRSVERTEHPGESGTSFWQTFEQGNVRVRLVEYSPGYRADHWCPRGHILLVMEGDLVIELRDGSRYRLTAGMSFQAEDDEKNPHLAFTHSGATVFIVD